MCILCIKCVYYINSLSVNYLEFLFICKEVLVIIKLGLLKLNNVNGKGWINICCVCFINSECID